MKSICEVTGLSDKSAEFLAELAKDKRTDILSLLNALLEDYSVDYLVEYDGQGRANSEKASSVLNAVIHYMSEYSRTEHAEDFMEFESIYKENRLECAYKQLLLNRVSDAIKASCERIRKNKMGLKRRGRKSAKK